MLKRQSSTTPRRWSNWSGSAQGQPSRFLQPADVPELQEVLRRAATDAERVKVVGAGHSFTPLAVTSGTLLNLDAFCGVRSHDPEAGTVTIAAGTRLRDIPQLLGPRGLALANQGDVDPQALAGAINTGTHGTGVGFTGFAGMVRSFRMVTADGELHDCRPDAPEEIDRQLFHYARVGLGAFGIMTEVELDCVESFLLEAVERAEPVDAVVDHFPERARAADHLEYYWFPGTDKAHVKTNTRRPASAPASPIPRWKELVDDELFNNALFGGLCHITSRIPRLTPPVARLCAATLAQREYSNLAHNVFVSSRRVHFNEMEYSIPLDDAPEVLREIHGRLATMDEQVLFPIEVRATAADEVPLSTAKGRQSCYIAIHRFHRDDHWAVFRQLEPVLMEAEGRPHWGKLHSLGYADLVERHEDLEAAAALRARVDPQGMFRNAMIDRIFDLDDAAPARR